MRFEQIVEKLYKKYMQAVSKEEMMKKIEEKARELGFSSIEVEFNEKTTEARAIVELNEETMSEEGYRRLREIAEWLVGELRIVDSLKLLITTEKKEDSELKGYVQDRAKQLGIKHSAYVQLDDDAYVDYFELERDDEQRIYVYLLIYNEYPA